MLGKIFNLVCVILVISFILVAADTQDITVEKFELLKDGSCCYKLKNNTTEKIYIKNFKITKDIDLVNNKYMKGLMIEGGDNKGVLWGAPLIEDICRENGGNYNLELKIKYKINSELKIFRKNIAGICKEL